MASRRKQQKQSLITRNEKRQKGMSLFRTLFRNRKKDECTTNDPQGETIFEPCDAPARPVISVETEYKLKWKNPHPEEKIEKIDDSEKLDIDELQKTPEFQLAKKVMTQLRQNNLLEDAADKEDFPVIQRFFKEDLNHPTKEIIDIIDQAMDYCYEEFELLQERQNLQVDPEMKEFLQDKEKAKECLLDVVMICSEFVPLIWGGESVVIPSKDDAVKPAAKGSNGKESKPPWNRFTKKGTTRRKRSTRRTKQKGTSSLRNKSVGKGSIKEIPKKMKLKTAIALRKSRSVDSKDEMIKDKKSRGGKSRRENDHDRTGASKSDEDTKKRSSESDKTADRTGSMENVWTAMRKKYSKTKDGKQKTGGKQSEESIRKTSSSAESHSRTSSFGRESTARSVGSKEGKKSTSSREKAVSSREGKYGEHVRTSGSKSRTKILGRQTKSKRAKS